MDNLQEAYNYGICPICKQGWLQFVKEISSGEIYVVCEECESEWDHPEKVKNINQSTQGKFGQAIFATESDIEEYGWLDFLIIGLQETLLLDLQTRFTVSIQEIQQLEKSIKILKNPNILKQLYTISSRVQGIDEIFDILDKEVG